MAVRPWRSFLALGLTMALLSGCANVKEELRPVELKPIKPEVKLVKKWSKSVGAGRDDRYARFQPALAEDSLYLVDVDGRVTALDAATGKRQWRSELSTQIGGGVGQGPGRVFVGSLDGGVYALDAKDGRVLWRAQASSEIASAPQANSQVVVTQAIDGRVFAYNLEDGTLRWSYDHPLPVLTLRSNAAPLVTEDGVFIGFDNGQLVRFDSDTGQLRWSARIGQPRGKTELERLVDVDSTPIAEGPYVYGAGVNGRLAAINRGTGRITWAQDVSTYHNLAEADGKIIVTDENSHVKAFNALTGELAWENDQLHRRGVSAPGVLGGVVVVTDDTGVVHGLALDDGRLVARRKLRVVMSQPVSSDQLIYVYDQEGTVTALELEPLKPVAVAQEGE